jgi:hypothetical protein
MDFWFTHISGNPKERSVALISLSPSGQKPIGKRTPEVPLQLACEQMFDQLLALQGLSEMPFVGDFAGLNGAERFDSGLRFGNTPQ